MAAARWNPEWDARLGTMSDTDLGRELGFHQSTVTLRRKLLGIPVCGRTGWDPAWDARLGTAPDAELAREWGVSSATVHAHRRAKGIRSHVPVGNRKWRDEWDSLVGTMSDVALAERLGVAPLTVYHHRRRLKVPAFGGRGHSGGAHRKWQDEWDARLGTATDQVLAEEFGVSVALVRQRRRVLGVGPQKAARDAAIAKVRALSDEALFDGEPGAVALRERVGEAFVVGERRARLGRAGAAPRGMAPNAMQRAAVAGMMACGNPTLRQIGDVLKVTRERARQLVEEVRAVIAAAEIMEGE